MSSPEDPTAAAASDEFPASAARWWSPAKRRWLLAAATLVLLALFLAGNHWPAVQTHLAVTWWADRAEEKLIEDDFQAAEENIEKALAWMPDSPQLLYLRAQIRQQAHDLQGALADYDQVIAAAPKFAPAYSARADVRRRLGLYHEALEDLNQVIQLRPADDPQPLNHRAYIRALAKLDLPQALEDIERALALNEHDVYLPAYLDTRGYIHYLLGNDELAQADITRAVDLAERYARQMLQPELLECFNPAQQARLRRLINENLAVLYHHRGLIHERLGQDELAQRDQQLAHQHGYDPFRGVE